MWLFFAFDNHSWVICPVVQGGSDRVVNVRDDGVPGIDSEASEHLGDFQVDDVSQPPACL